MGFHDWADFSPFYQKKFLSVGLEDTESQNHINASRRLFEISFPEFAVRDNVTLIKMLQDKRIEDLRQLVQSSIEGSTEFDEKFARRTLIEVLGVEKQVAKYRNIISYLTIPLDFLPWVGTVAQKATEEGVGFLAEKKLRSKYRWFYLLSDLANIED